MNEPEANSDAIQRSSSTHRLAQSEFVKNWLEVVGLIIGGIWVAVVFGLRECPAREPNFEQSGSLEWFPGPTSDACVANWHLTLKNISTGTVDVKHVHLTIWKFDLPKSGPKPSYVDIVQLRPRDSRALLFERWFADDGEPFVYNFPPNAASTQAFEFVCNRPTRTTWIAFELGLHRSKTEPPLWHSYDWSPICGEGNVPSVAPSP